MPVVLAALGELLHIGVLGLETERARLLAVARLALTLQMVEIRTSVARRALCRTIRVLIMASRERLVAAGWPGRWRPAAAEHEARGALILPISADMTACFWAAASAWAKNSFGCWI